ncbi:glycosyltransferase [Reyranella sp.]|uniref:glycosyltransferase n=1 Tax=Reyranella sp. TaxID=1929291 RepID=UPI003BABB2A8
MTLSVVVPARDAAATLAATLDSLLAQTRRDWQAIVVDDGSVDATPRIVEDYRSRDRRFCLVASDGPAQGVSAARNRGIVAAGGRWLLFLDADDTIEPSFVERMLERLEGTEGARVAYCGSRRITAAGRRGPAWISTAVAREPFETLARDFPLVMHGVVLERSLAVELGGFDTALRTAEDMDFFQRVARTGTPFLLVPEAMALYRMRAGSLSTDPRAMLDDTARVIARAFGRDPRVARPAARHADGADPGAGSLEMAIGLNALWCAALDIGRGGEGRGFVRPLPDRGPALAESCRHAIVEGLAFGAQRLTDELRDCGATVADRLHRLLAEVEAAARRPGLAGRLAFALEPEILKPEAPSQRMVAGDTLLARRDLTRLAPLEAAAGIDRAYVEFRQDGRLLGAGETPALGDLSPRDLLRVALDTVGLADLLKASRLVWRPDFWLRAGWAAARLGGGVVLDKARHRAVAVRSLRALLKRSLGEAALGATGGPDTTAAEIDRLIAEGEAMARQAAPTTRPRTLEAPPAWSDDRRAYWEAVYRTEDPWAYGSAYEQLKYRRTLDLVPPGPVGRAIELACSEGRFTAMLAPRVGHLVASDISQTALDRARTRCRDHGNIDYRRLDLFDDNLPADMDLVVCSEVLYDLADRDELQRVAARLAGMLVPGGRLLAAHAFVLKDDPHATGYDWDCAFGAETIATVLGATPGLALERSLRTELYRIDLFRRIDGLESAPTPRLETIALGPSPEPDYARHVVWDGAVVLRADAQARESTPQLPVLLYHRIAEDGPAALARWRQTPEDFTAQMRWLRRNGYHAVSSDTARRHLADGRPFPGRPVLITFDDGYLDFHVDAWPILRANDFTAEVFVVTDRVGRDAAWDAALGPPAPLMDWPHIQELAAQGVGFGSHMASHAHMADLSSRDIVLEAARSRSALERALGRSCDAIAAPFGETDARFRRIVRQCGYSVGFGTEPGPAGPDHDCLQLPRIEVVGGWSLDTFANAVRAR